MPATIVSLDLAFRDSAHLREEGHSFANQINVVHAELQLLERMSEPHPDLKPVIQLCEVAARAFKSETVVRRNSEELQGLRRRVHAVTGSIVPRSQYAMDAEDAVRIIGEVLDDVTLRIHETLARYRISHTRETFAESDFVAAVKRGFHPNDPVTVSTPGAILVPPALPDVVGRLGRELVGLGAGPLQITVKNAAGGRGDRIEINSTKVVADLLPATPPRSVTAKSGEQRVRALVAWIVYLVSPDGVVSVNPDGTPFLAVTLAG